MHRPKDLTKLSIASANRSMAFVLRIWITSVIGVRRPHERVQEHCALAERNAQDELPLGDAGKLLSGVECVVFGTAIEPC
jgi:hypothetical protein